jgi:hypothetical protein
MRIMIRTFLEYQYKITDNGYHSWYGILEAVNDADTDIVIKLWKKPIAFYWRMSQSFEESNLALLTDPIPHVLEDSMPRNSWRWRTIL